MFALLISMPRFKSIIFHQNSLKLSYFCHKMQNFQRLGAPLPDLHASGGCRFCPQTSMPPAAVGFVPRPPASGGWGLSSWTFNGFRRLRSQTPKTAPPPIVNFGYERLNVVWIWSANRGADLLLSIGGDNLQFYPDFALFSTFGGMNLDYDFFRRAN